MSIISDSKIVYDIEEYFINDISGSGGSSGGIENGSFSLVTGDPTLINIGTKRDVKFLLVSLTDITGILRFYISALDDDGNNFVKLATISGRDKTYRSGTTTLLKNNATSYSTIKIAIEGSGTFCVGEIMIFGTQKP